MLYGLAVFPSEDIQQFANLYRRRYDTHYPLIRPHLTLREKAYIPQERLEETLQHLTEAAKQLPPFELSFNRFSTFYPASNVIYMALADPEPMHHAYQTLCRGPLTEESKPYAFTPHLTIAQELGDDELHDVLSSLRNQRLDYRCMIDRFVLLQQAEDGSWRTIKEFPLSAQEI